jgi:hypothetical protein
MITYCNNNKPIQAIALTQKLYFSTASLGLHGVLVVVLLGETLVLQELGVDTTEGRETVGLDLLNTVTVVFLVLVVVGVIL